MPRTGTWRAGREAARVVDRRGAVRARGWSARAAGAGVVNVAVRRPPRHRTTRSPPSVRQRHRRGRAPGPPRVSRQLPRPRRRRRHHARTRSRSHLLRRHAWLAGRNRAEHRPRAGGPRETADRDRPDWNCPWPLDWQRHYAVLRDLAADEPHGVLPDIKAGVLMDGDDIGRWLQRHKNRVRGASLSAAQQERLSELGIRPAEAPSPAPTAKRATKAQQAFQRGLTALTQWVEREGQRPVPRGHSEEIAVQGEAEPVVVKLGVMGIEHSREAGQAHPRATGDATETGNGLGMIWPVREERTGPARSSLTACPRCWLSVGD
ncbi:helicase associated domain-containing protein [Streptomyces mutabilis]|uniref:helicase associated domain-containing protein n=1 Tax=Streptomyces mutabilis TaxID=67332 RepID=UPI00406BA0B3